MKKGNKILIGVIAAFLLFIIFFDRISLYIYEQDEETIDQSYDHILMEADSAIVKADKAIKEFHHLQEMEKKTKLGLDSLKVSAQAELAKLKRTESRLYLTNARVQTEQSKIDGLLVVIDSLKYELANRPDSLKYNFIYRDSIIYVDSIMFVTTYDTTVVMIKDTVKYNKGLFRRTKFK